MRHLRQKQVCQNGRQRERDDQRRENRHDIGNPERSEELPFDPGEEEQGKEDQHDDESPVHDRIADFAGRVVDDTKRRQRVFSLTILA